MRRKIGRKPNLINSAFTPFRTIRPVYCEKRICTGYETEDLMIVNQSEKRVEVLFKEPNRDENRTSFTGETKIQTVDFASTPETILPMRLNVMGQQGFVVFGKGSLEPAMVMVAPNAVFQCFKNSRHQ